MRKDMYIILRYDFTLLCPVNGDIIIKTNVAIVSQPINCASLQSYADGNHLFRFNLHMK